MLDNCEMTQNSIELYNIDIGYKALTLDRLRVSTNLCNKKFFCEGFSVYFKDLHFK
jgi:hypothetical protein